MKMESREMILANTGSHSKNKKECLDLFPEKKKTLLSTASTALQLPPLWRSAAD